MLRNAVHQPEQTTMDQAASPLSAQIVEFCESEIFQQNSEAASSSMCCYDDHSSYTNNLSFPPDKPPMTTNTDDTNNSFCINIFSDEINENDINSANLDFTYQYSHHQDQFDLITTNHNNTINNSPYHHSHPNDHVVPVTGSASSIPPSKFMRLNKPSSSPNCSFMDASIKSYLSGNTNPPLSVENSVFNGNLFLDFKGDCNNGGVFCPDPLPQPYNYNELQALSNESQQHLVDGGGSCGTPLASEITSLEADTYRVTSKLTTKERKEKIHRYMKKRNHRNFSKKIKYACRKTLADSRPRVRGRFAKNDEFGDNIRTTHEEDTDEDVKSFHVAVKEEEDNFESSDIFAHISGVNSFKCNFPIQSWI